MQNSLEWRPLADRSGPAGFLKVIARTYRLPDGTDSEWDILCGGDTVAIVAQTTEDEFVLVRQYRPGPAKVLLELPGGNANDGEEVVSAAARELLEETGYVATDLTVVGSTWLAGYATHRRHAVLATGCRLQQAPNPDAEEFCEVVLLPREGFLAHIRTGELTDVDMAYMCLAQLPQR